MQTAVRKWGNSAALRIPASLMQEAGVAIDQPVEIGVRDGVIVIEPVRPTAYELAALVASITNENRHDLTDAGTPFGNETW